MGAYLANAAQDQRLPPNGRVTGGGAVVDYHSLVTNVCQRTGAQRRGG